MWNFNFSYLFPVLNNDCIVSIKTQSYEKVDKALWRQPSCLSASWVGITLVCHILQDHSENFVHRGLGDLTDWWLGLGIPDPKCPNCSEQISALLSCAVCGEKP